MATPITTATVRICQAGGEVVGAGFLVSETHVLTCAHVVAQAIALPLDTAIPSSDPIYLDFPLLAPGRLLTTRIVFWQPVHHPAADHGSDIAILELADLPPPQAQPIRLVTADNLWGHPFRVFGFPVGHDDGVWAAGILRDRQTGGRIQIEVVQETGYRIEPGFSGAPVWDETLEGVVGMTVTTERRRQDVKAAFIIPTTQLVNGWSGLRELTTPPCPYRGLFAFREEDAALFFGRAEFGDRLVALVAKQSLVAVVGASGSGKSSVVFAGLLPRLRQQGHWQTVTFRPTSRPLYALAAALMPQLEPAISPFDRLEKTRQFATDLQRVEMALRDAIESIIWASPGVKLLLVIDQFEELYTLCQDSQEQKWFLDQLLAAIQHVPNVTIVMTLRADFCGHALSYRPFADALQYADLKLGPMNRQELRTVIEAPAWDCRVSLEAGLADRILEAVGDEPGNLPLLEFALTLLWESQEHGKLTHTAYDAIGGVEQALATYAQQKYGELPEAEQPIAQQILLELVQPGEGTPDTRRQVHKRHLLTGTTAAQGDRVLQRLVAAKLVVTGEIEQDGERIATVDLVHEALIQHWTRLRQWLADQRESLQKCRRLEAAAREWEAQGKPDTPAYLWQGARLSDAETFVQNYATVELSPLAQAFLRASYTARNTSRLKTGLAIALPTIAIATAGLFLWQQLLQQRIQQLQEAVLLGTSSPELLAVLPAALEKAADYAQTGDTERALASYQNLLSATINFKHAIAQSPTKFQPQDNQTVQQIAITAERSLVQIIQTSQFPQLTAALSRPPYGRRLDNTSALKFENQFSPGALRITYTILMRPVGARADWNNDGTINDADEGDRLPCQLLQELEALWRKSTQNRCGWYGNHSFYKASACKELGGRTLMATLFFGPYDPVANRIKICKLAPPKADIYQ